ncbi:MAG: pilus assembly protein TadG-related protein [Anderseniella sp.]|jgi:Flp pilus assembly protein TadG|nr:pilus assembly protein TadG-related protein [Anderseniella sp.]
MLHRTRKFLNHSAGSVAIMFGIAAPVLVGVAGVAVDYARYNSTVANLQGLADGAAVAAVRGMAVANTNANTAESTVDSYVRQKAEEMAWQKGGQDIEVTTQISPAGDAVEVQLSQEWSPMLAHVLIGEIKTPVVVSTTAKLVGGTKICVLALDPGVSAALTLTGDAVLEANGCGAYSNSVSTTGLSSYKNSLLTASAICSAGGYGGSTSNFNPAPLTDCPAMADPLAGRPAPAVGACDYTNMSVNSETRTLQPGVYCGGLLISGTSNVTFDAGTYIIKDGGFQVTHTATVTGTNVGFFLTGSGTRFLFAGGSTVSLSAPTSGDMAGLLFFEDRLNPAGQNHEIVSENARELVGTIYLPKGSFAVSSKKPVADQSAYTAIIANSIQLHKYPRLVLNTNYEQTNVPVPSGLVQTGGSVVLTK